MCPVTTWPGVRAFQRTTDRSIGSYEETWMLAPSSGKKDRNYVNDERGLTKTAFHDLPAFRPDPMSLTFC